MFFRLFGYGVEGGGIDYRGKIESCRGFFWVVVNMGERILYGCILGCFRKMCYRGRDLFDLDIV